MKHAVVIGAGPAGLMAAEVMAQAGVQVTVCDAKPSVGRKFLMAGKSGLNITKEEPEDMFGAAFTQSSAWLAPMIQAFGPHAVQDWAQGLAQELFVGTTGRVFPVAMKASPLLRAWLARLEGLGVTFQTRWRWTGWEGNALRFDTADGAQLLHSDATVLALGGASWQRLGSDGAWATLLAQKGVPLADFEPANAGMAMDWSAHMQRHLGTALKNIALRSGPYQSRGEAVLSRSGLEGGGVYSVSRGVREGHVLMLDLMPDQTVQAIEAKLSKPRGKTTLTNHLRKSVKLDPAKIAVLQEMNRPLPQDTATLAGLIKSLEVRHAGLRPLDEAISTAGGVTQAACDEALMLHALPNTYVAGEMLDWEAPTGGYLISACLATGAWAGRKAATRLNTG